MLSLIWSLCHPLIVLVRPELYDEAAVMLREHAKELPGLSERLPQFLALGSALALMRARRAWATHEASSSAAGSAVTSLHVGYARLRCEGPPAEAQQCYVAYAHHATHWRCEAETSCRSQLRAIVTFLPQRLG